MDPVIEQLVTVVQVQDFPHRDEFLDAVASGQSALRTSHEDGSSTASSEVLDIYRHRYAHLAREHSAHAQSLASDVAWFCANLEKVPNGRVAIWIVDIGRPYSLDFFLDTATKKVLGCMKTVSQLDVTPEEWERLWSDA